MAKKPYIVSGGVNSTASLFGLSRKNPSSTAVSTAHSVAIAWKPPFTVGTPSASDPACSVHNFCDGTALTVATKTTITNTTLTNKPSANDDIVYATRVDGLGKRRNQQQVTKRKDNK